MCMCMYIYRYAMYIYICRERDTNYIHVYTYYKEMYPQIYIHTHTYLWQRLKNIGLVAGLGGLFGTRLVTESVGLATNPPCNKPTEDYSTLHRGPRHGFVTEGPRQRYVTQGGGGDRDKPLFRVTAIYARIHTCMRSDIHIRVHIHIHTQHPYTHTPTHTHKRT